MAFIQRTDNATTNRAAYESHSGGGGGCAGCLGDKSESTAEWQNSNKCETRPD